MVHGDCSSSGCYAMTDEQMGEIYALGRESFFGGQKSFQVQAYPFRMTPLNMAKHRNSPNMAFWRMIKEGSDQFEVTRQEPKVDVCEKRYVFNAAAPAGAATDLKFSPKGKCPTYEVPQEIASLVSEKREKDEREFAALVSRGTPTVAVRTGNDGGMHPTFAAKLKPPEQFDNEGRVRVASTASTPIALPPTINPPRNLQSDGATGAIADRRCDAPVADPCRSDYLRDKATTAEPVRVERQVGRSARSRQLDPIESVRTTRIEGRYSAAAAAKSASVNAGQAKTVPAKPVPAAAHSAGGGQPPSRAAHGRRRKARDGTIDHDRACSGYAGQQPAVRRRSDGRRTAGDAIRQLRKPLGRPALAHVPAKACPARDAG